MSAKKASPSPPAFLLERKALVEDAIERQLPPRSAQAPELFDAMRYALSGAGKRVRPVLVFEAAELLKRPAARVDFLAAAVEFIHSASLVLDDLPSMDDAATRRGQPAVHAKFGEALAILAAIALLMRATEVIAQGCVREKIAREVTAELIAMASATVGADGMAAGQWADLAKMGAGATLSTIEFVHRRKTGRLFELSLRGSALLCGAHDAELAALDAYGKNLGLAFQVKDDLLDVEGDAAVLGKPAGKDREKTTFVDLAGLEPARALVRELIATASDALGLFGKRADRLQQLATYVRDRDR
ncbi:MAG: polyprenyl synthetase family protein [Planctomycetes bacterium]|nr:polyprenyl synthetase family protein [Planctomycetota bacterium]